MRAPMAEVILTGATAALAVVLGGIPSSAATAKTLTVTPGGAAEAKSGKITLADTNPRQVITSPLKYSDGSSSDSSNLDGVSCTSGSRCEAVGSTYSGAALADGWNGTTWRAQTVPNPASGEPILEGVSCTGADACEAVGYHTNSSDVFQAVVDHWDGTSWQVQATLSPGGTDRDSELYGVSCVTADRCEAVGSYVNRDSEPLTLAEVWNGSTWQQQPAPNPGPDVPGETGDALESVSCTAASNCEAVGDYTNSSFVFTTLAEVWNGSSWKQQSTRGSNVTILLGVSCSAANSCEAVGDTNTQAFAEAWNGTTWTKQSVASPGSAWHLYQPSCPAADACEAVGNGTILAEGWNGTSWVRQSAPDPSGEVTLDSVSCPGAKTCEAVGGDSSNSGLAAESWNGTAWKLQTVP
jgi:hypothetical protein